MELEDLPPRYRAQAEAQIAARSRGKCVSPQAIPDAARTAGKLGKAFESRGEYEYYMSVIVPGIQSGKILKATTHVAIFLCCLQRNMAMLNCLPPGIRQTMC